MLMLIEMVFTSQHSANGYEELPKGCRVVSTESHGTSFWAKTGRIVVDLADGSSKSYFIKVVLQEVGKNMVHSEFESTKAIHMLLPDFTPEPIAWGSYETVDDTHFYLCEFREMSDEMPDPEIFASRLAALHNNSKSPENKFGFHMTTYNGNLPQLADWESSWETYFMKSLRLALEFELEAKGPDSDFENLLPVLFDKVIPRLLRPLESEGRSIKPTLVHGDLWYANSGIDVNTYQPLIFDACSFYAHNECKLELSRIVAAGGTDISQDEFGQWRPICNRFGDEYLDAYHAYVPISPPEEDYHGRLDLYKL